MYIQIGIRNEDVDICKQIQIVHIHVYNMCIYIYIHIY